MYILFIFQLVKSGTVFKSTTQGHVYSKDKAQKPLVLLLSSSAASLDADNVF